MNLSFRFLRQRAILLFTNLLLALLLASPVTAVTVTGLYEASVDYDGSSQNAAFRRGLAEVLVKVTGRVEAGTPEYLNTFFPNPAELVQQYSVVGAGDELRVSYDARAIRSRLDSAGQPVWGQNRPEVLLWLALDMGNGQREILSADSEGLPPLEPQPAEVGLESPELASQLVATPDTGEISARMQEIAAERGLPLVLPLGDLQDYESLSFAELWGEFTEEVRSASARYAPDAILVGLAETFPGRPARVRWALLIGEETEEWEGTLDDGPNGAADRLAANLATLARDASEVSISVVGLNSTSDYARVTNYLQSLGIVEKAGVRSVSEDRVTFDLRIRGDADRLRYALATGRVLEARSERELRFGLWQPPVVPITPEDETLSAPDELSPDAAALPPEAADG